MKNDVFKIYANFEDKMAVEEILENVSPKVVLSSKTVSVFLKEYEVSAQSDIYVVKSSDKAMVPSDKRVITYSKRLGDGMVTALNPQEREFSRSFEIMTENFMGRAYLPKDSKFTMLQVLASFTALLALGADARSVLAQINEYTKGKD